MKRILSFFLCFCLILTGILAPSISAEGANVDIPTVDGDSYPFILIRGVDFGAMSTDYGTPKQAPAVEPITADSVILALLKAAGAAVLRRSFDPLVDGVLDYASEVSFIF